MRLRKKDEHLNFTSFDSLSNATKKALLKKEKNKSKIMRRNAFKKDKSFSSNLGKLKKKQMKPKKQIGLQENHRNEFQPYYTEIKNGAEHRDSYVDRKSDSASRIIGISQKNETKEKEKVSLPEEEKSVLHLLKLREEKENERKEERTRKEILEEKIGQNNISETSKCIDSKEKGKNYKAETTAAQMNTVEDSSVDEIETEEDIPSFPLWSRTTSRKSSLPIAKVAPGTPLQRRLTTKRR
eukprot:g4594.t1